ncbi:ribonuclease H-like domain-containing protein [Tanacetum coccineum]
MILRVFASIICLDMAGNPCFWEVKVTDSRADCLIFVRIHSPEGAVVGQWRPPRSCNAVVFSVPRMGGDCLLHVRETITITLTQNTDGIVQVEENPIRIIPGLADIVQLAKISKQSDIHEGDLKTFLKNEKLEQVVAIIKLYSSNVVCDLKVTVKYLFGTLPGSIHYKVINEEGYRKEITVGSAIILANVSVFSPNPSMHYLNITKKKVVKVFHKDFVPGNCSGVGGSEMLMEEEEIVKLVEEEEMADLELHVCGNVIDQEDLYKFDEESLDLVLEAEARESRAYKEWLEKCRQQEEEDAEYKRQLLGFHGTI